MASLTNVFAVHEDATGTMYAGATNLAGYQLASGGVAGEIVFRDGGSGGTTLIEIDIPSNSNPNSFYVAIPQEGVLFTTNVYATLTNIASVTVFYG
jgi:hypothetical protein